MKPHKQTSVSNDKPYAEQIKIVSEWISLQKATKSINRRHNSYSYKHIVQSWAETYISEDAFIDAVKKSSLKWSACGKKSKSIRVAISEKNVKYYGGNGKRIGGRNPRWEIETRNGEKKLK